MSKLPLKLQVGIRDHWANPTSAVQKAIKNVEEVLGVRTTINPEWSLILSELDSFYPDKATLAPSLAAVVEAWCTALVTLADDEANSEWADELLERTGGHIRVSIEVSNNREITLTWSNPQKAFIISLIKNIMTSQSYMQSLFSGSLSQCFSQSHPATSSLSTSADTPTTAAAAVDDWADISVDNTTGKAGIIEPVLSIRPPHPQAQANPEFDIIPDINTLPRPDELLLKPPYHLTVYAGTRHLVEVHCSHSPTLQFLSDYLKKWSRTNHNNTTKPPYATITLHQSPFGLGIIHERLTMSCEESRFLVQAISPTTILALVEGVLGYRNVSVDRSSWTYRRDVEFRRGRY